MFHISVKTDYAILLMLALAEHYDDGRISLTRVSREQHLPYRFLGQIAMKLKDAGLVDAKEGAGGGYYLVHRPSRITVGEILRAMEGNAAVARCMTERGVCPKVGTCTLPPLWSRLTLRINRTFDRLTLATLLLQPKKARGQI